MEHVWEEIAHGIQIGAGTQAKTLYHLMHPGLEQVGISLCQSDLEGAEVERREIRLLGKLDLCRECVHYASNMGHPLFPARPNVKRAKKADKKQLELLR